MSENRLHHLLRNAKLSSPAEQHLLEHYLFTITSQTSAYVGVEFMQQLLIELCHLTKMDYALIGEIVESPEKSVKTLALCLQNKIVDNIDYLLANTPCEQAAQNSFCVLPENVQLHFPKDELLMEMGIESYVGMPLVNRHNKVIGLLVLMHTQPLQHAFLLEHLLLHLTLRISTELQRLIDERQLRLANDIFNNLSDGLMITDAQRRIQAINPAFTRITGYSAADVIGFKPSILSSGQHSTTFYQSINKLLDLSGIWKGEITNKRKNGELYQERLTIDAIKDEQGVVCNYIGIFHDVTLRKKQEAENQKLTQQLLQAQKMEAIGQLTGGIAHDFNNILACIGGYIDLSQQHLQQHPDNKMASYTIKIEQACDRATKLVRQLLTFSSNKQDEPQQPIALGERVQNCIEMLKPTFPSSIQLKLHINTEAAILCSPTQFDQMIMNLAINARDAMQNKGNISFTVNPPRVHAGFCNACFKPFKEELVEIIVSDDGCGITQDHLERIFEPFYTTKHKDHGTGMGLSIIHGIVHHCHGHIVVKTELTRGTNFHLYFPQTALFDVPHTLPTHKTVKKMKTTSAQSFLLVDDEPMVGEMLKEFLENNEYTVVYFQHSPDALAWFEQHPDQIALVLTDQTMPDLTGSEMAQKMLSIAPKTPIILCSGYTNAITKTEALNMGIRAFIAKPFNYPQLLETIAELISQNQ